MARLMLRVNHQDIPPLIHRGGGDGICHHHCSSARSPVVLIGSREYRLPSIFLHLSNIPPSSLFFYIFSAQESIKNGHRHTKQRCTTTEKHLVLCSFRRCRCEHPMASSPGTSPSTSRQQGPASSTIWPPGSLPVASLNGGRASSRGNNHGAGDDLRIAHGVCHEDRKVSGRDLRFNGYHEGNPEQRYNQE